MPVSPSPTQPGPSRHVLRDISLLTLSAWVAQALLLYRSYLIPKGLGPEGFAHWRVLTLIMLYGVYTHMGVLEAFQREAPMLRGRGEHDRLRACTNSTWGFWLLTSLGTALVLAAYAILTRGAHSTVVTRTLLMMAPLLVMQSLDYFQRAKLCSEARFGPVSVAMSIQAAVNLTIVLLLLNRTGVYGAVIGLLAAYLATNLYLALHIRQQLAPRIDWSIVRHLLQMGLPISLFLFLYHPLMTIDQMLVIRMLGREPLGIYALSFTILMILAKIPSMTNTAIEPRLLRDAARHGIGPHTYQLVTSQMLILSLLVPAGAGLAAIMSGPFLNAFLPRFAPAAPIIIIHLIGWTPLMLTHPLKSLIILRQMQWRCIPVMAAGIGLCAGLNYGAIRAGWGLPGVAAGTACAYGATGAALIALVLRDGFERRKDAVFFSAELTANWAASIACAAGVMLAVRFADGPLRQWLESAVQAAAFLMLFGIFALLRARKEYSRVKQLMAEMH